jgi:hypothetical protein
MSNYAASRKEAKLSAGGGAMDCGDVEMHPESARTAERSTDRATEDSSDPIWKLALNLDLISPETPLLSSEDRHDLAMFDKLTQAEARLQRSMGLETEMVETGKWNFDTVLQLIDLAHQTSKIPFASKPELYNLKPTSADIGVVPPSPTAKAKGKQRADCGPKRRSIYSIFPESSRAWSGRSGEYYLLNTSGNPNYFQLWHS